MLCYLENIFCPLISPVERLEIYNIGTGSNLNSMLISVSGAGNFFQLCLVYYFTRYTENGDLIIRRKGLRRFAIMFNSVDIKKATLVGEALKILLKS